MQLRKVFGLFSALVVLLSMVSVVPVSAATSSTSTDWNYIPLNRSVQLTNNGTFPNGIPLCKSASLVNIVCYSPAFVKKAYQFPSTATLDGSGQTIVIVDAFGSPTITSDLALFDSSFGIPAPPSFTIFCGDSSTPFVTSTCPSVPITANAPHAVLNWEVETSLDVEYAHAMAPGANIVLDVAATSSGNAINAAETAAIATFPGVVFSQSFGVPESLITANNNQVMQAQANYVAGVAKGDTFFASAGDTGATFGTSEAMSNFPASDVNNTNVTGTQGLPYIPIGHLNDNTLTSIDGLVNGGCPTSTPFSCTTGLSAFHGPCVLGRTVPPNCVPDGYGGEQVWNEPVFGAATGGAPSLLFGVPSYQAGLGLSARGPDVDYNAAVDGGVLVAFSGLGTPGLFIVGGTSAGSPQWAGITALANQARANLGKGTIGEINPVLYSIYHSARYAADFHDITVGNDQLVGTPIGFSAGNGYDLASGIGTPVVDELLVDLAAAP